MQALVVFPSTNTCLLYTSYINLMKGWGILEDTDNPLKPYNIVKTKEEIAVLIHQYLPDLLVQMNSEQLSDNYLHCNGDDRRHAADGI